MRLLEVQSIPRSHCIWFVLRWAAMSVLSCGCVAEPDFAIKAESAAKLHRIAVLDFADAPGADAGYSGRVVAGIIAKHVIQIDTWQGVERNHLDKILAEQDLQASVCANPTAAVEIGKILGADGIIVGEVAQYRIGSIPFLFFFTFDQDVYKVDFSFRLISVETGDICLSSHVASQSIESFEQAIAEGLSETFANLQLVLERARESE